MCSNTMGNIIKKLQEQQYETLFHHADIFVSRFKFENKQTMKNFLKFWIRYVDDRLAIIDYNFDEEKFSDNLKCQYPTV